MGLFFMIFYNFFLVLWFFMSIGATVNTTIHTTNIMQTLIEEIHSNEHI